MCGILGIYGQGDVTTDLISGLNTLQHRGQDAAGIVTFDRTFRMEKGLGLVNQVFRKTDLTRLAAPCGLGHVRYATQGRNEVLGAQPFAINYPSGMAMVHNGNVVNFQALRRSLYEEHNCVLETSNDLELILYTFASELVSRDPRAPTPDDIFAAVEATQTKVDGAYSTITILANNGFLAFTDPAGIRPLVMGRRLTPAGPEYAFSSESTCFDYLGYERVRDLQPGEAVYIDPDRQIHTRICKSDVKRAFCIFEYIYFSREDTIIHDRPVARERVRMGKRLAETFEKTGLEPDIVIDVPASAYFFASGLAEALEVPYRRGLAKNRHIGRSFISPTKEAREKMVRQKVNPITDVIEGRRIAVVDDSVVRGTTSRHLVRLLRERGAREVYFVSAAPPLRYPCVYGIDMSIKREMIAAMYSEADTARYIGADALVYQSLDDLRDLYADLPCCYACFSGEYPTPMSAGLLQEIETERVCSKQA
jgi:amidophosphoribosyltransferase